MRSIIFMWVCLALHASVQAETLFVGGAPPPCSNCWFQDIQSAINAASDGDLILVRYGVYDAFNLGKAVLVKGSVRPFRVANSSPIRIRNVSTGRVGVVGAIYDWSLCETSDCNFEDSVIIENCTAEVVLGDFSVVTGSQFNGRAREISISRCTNVSLTNVTTESGSIAWNRPSHQSILIRSSRVRITGSNINGHRSWDLSGQVTQAAVGIRAVNSNVVIAQTHVKGGSGWYSDIGAGAQPGAHGVFARNCDLTILGTGFHVIQGGTGDWVPGRYCTGGGDGLQVIGAGTTTVSQVTLQGGDSCPSGEGEDWVGEINFDGRIPYLFGNGNLNPGDTLSVTTGCDESGLAIILMSLLSDSVTLDSFIGPPLATVLLEGSSAVLPAGLLVGGSELTVHCPIPNDESCRGLKIELQMALIGTTDAFLSNGHTVVIGE